MVGCHATCMPNEQQSTPETYAAYFFFTKICHGVVEWYFKPPHWVWCARAGRRAAATRDAAQPPRGAACVLCAGPASGETLPDRDPDRPARGHAGSDPKTPTAAVHGGRQAVAAGTGGVRTAGSLSSTTPYFFGFYIRYTALRL